MKTTLKGLLAGTAALAIAACTPPAEDGTDGAETAEATDEAAAGDEAMMAEDDEMPEAGAEAAAETEENERDPHGNPAGPLRSDSEQ